MQIEHESPTLVEAIERCLTANARIKELEEENKVLKLTHRAHIRRLEETLTSIRDWVGTMVDSVVSPCQDLRKEQSSWEESIVESLTKKKPWMTADEFIQVLTERKKP